MRHLISRADIVHVMGFRDPIGTVAAVTGLRQGTPYVLEPVGMHRRRIRSERLKFGFDVTIGRRIVARAGRIVATSRLEAKELAADGVPGAQIVIRANGVSANELLPLPSRGSFRRVAGIPDHVPLVLSLGRITRKKRLEALAEAVAALDGVSLAIVGPAERDGALARINAIAAETDGRIHVMPHGLWGGDKAAAFADADAFCLPSSTENFGNAAAEAAISGLPVVVSDQCGVAEWLPEGASWTVEVGDVAGLRRALAESLDPRVSVLAHDNAASLADSLSWGRLARDQESIYRSALRETQTGRLNE
jgi:glycosyltransferase involved in cell wall biosynthesis